MNQPPMQSAVPSWPYFVTHVLGVLEKRDVVRRRELLALVTDSAQLSASAREETIPSGKSKAHHRITWAMASLYKAGWIERPHRGIYRITPDGAEWFNSNKDTVLTYRDANELFDQFWRDSPNRLPAANDAAEPDNTVLSPTEQIEAGINRVERDVAAQLLVQLRDSDPGFFEDAVVKLLLAMGYGGAEQRGQRIGGTGDGGIDGVIDQDALGLDRIYVQAKRYSEGNNVGREAIQAFIGALHGLGASRGVFITSSAFTSHARDYADQVPSRIVLIDGERLVSLMIAYRVGVRVTRSYHAVEVDEDFFE